MTEQEKENARSQVHRAVKSGKLVRPDRCDNCQETCRPEGHHEDYNKPLEVIWLCKFCHTDAHYPLGRQTPKYTQKQVAAMIEAEFEAGTLVF